jgi:transposase
MSAIRKSYDKEFKLEALRLAETSDKTVSQIERELGLPKGSLFRWRAAFARQGAEAFPGKGRLPASEEQLRRLERENLILREERDILKKAIAVLSPKRG